MRAPVGGRPQAARVADAAATFGTLMLSGNPSLTQMGFAVAFGNVTAAFMMAMFFTPSLTA